MKLTLSQMLAVFQSTTVGFLCHAVAMIAEDQAEESQWIEKSWQRVKVNAHDLRNGMRDIAPEYFTSYFSGVTLLDLWVNWDTIREDPDFKDLYFEEGGAIMRNQHFRTLLLKKIIERYGDRELTVDVDLNRD